MNTEIRVSICSSKHLLVNTSLSLSIIIPDFSIGLNYQLQKAGSNVTVVAFIIMPATTHSYTIEALKGQAVTKQLRDTVTEIQNRIGARLFDHAARFHGQVMPLLPLFIADHPC